MHHRLASARLFLLPVLALALLASARAAAQCDLIVASFGNDKIVRYAADGTLVGNFVAPGSGGLDAPHAMCWGPDGHLYVASLNSGDVMRYDGATGAPLPGPNGGAGTAEFVPAGLGGLFSASAVIFDDQGRLYVSSLAGDRVLRYDGATGDFIDTFVSPGEGGLDGGEFMQFDADGHLYVGSMVNSAVMRYDGATGDPLPGPNGAAGTAQFVRPGSGGLAMPHGILFGPDGSLYVASFGNSAVRRYDGSSGAFIETFVAPGSGGLSQTHGFQFDDDGRFYVVGFGTTTVLRYDAGSGAFIDQLFAPGQGGLSQAADLLFFDCAAPCPEDLDGSGAVDFGDLLGILAAWGICPACPEDLDGSGDVGFPDLLQVLGAWGACE